MAILNNIAYIINEGFEGPVDAKPVGNMNGKTIAEAIMQTAEERNRNGRYYCKNDLFPQLTCPRTVELIEAGYLRSEMGHPLEKSLARQSIINDEKTCARILALWTNGNDVWGRVVGTNNANGRAFDLDLKEGCKPAWSLRALGTVQQTARGAEVKNLRLITYDQVIYPSHPGAYTQRIVSENAEMDLLEGVAGNDRSGEALLFPIDNQDVISYIQQESGNIKFIRDYFDFQYNDIKVDKSGTRVTLQENNGNLIVVPLEQHIHNEFMTYANNFKNLFED